MNTDKSQQAKRQLRNPDGTFKDENRDKATSARRKSTAPQESYKDGAERMYDLDCKFMDIANSQMERREFALDEDVYRVDAGTYIKQETLEQLPELDRYRYIAWSNDAINSDNEEYWNDVDEMADIANESLDDDAECYLTTVELQYTSDQEDFYFRNYGEEMGWDWDAIETGVNSSLYKHPDIGLNTPDDQIFNGRYQGVPQVYSHDDDNPRTVVLEPQADHSWKMTYGYDYELAEGQGKETTICVENIDENDRSARRARDMAVSEEAFSKAIEYVENGHEI